MTTGFHPRRKTPLIPRPAFTLIELLVVIAIIAILTVILPPAPDNAKAKAQSVLCQSNLKQLQLAWMSYTTDNSDRLPLNLMFREWPTERE